MATLGADMIDSHGVRRKDTTKGPALRILSLDGGGVRGYSMLIILQELMHRTFVEMEGRAPKRNEIPKPCDHFDLIVGTGTGGLVALMLGRLRLSIETCKDVYVRMTKRVFETDKTIAGIPYRSTLFKASKLEDAIKDCVREHTLYFDEGNDEDDGDQDAPDSPASTIGPMPSRQSIAMRPGRSPSVASRYSQIGASYTTMDVRQSRSSHYGNPVSSRWGNPNALLYDNRENRTKTAVTAVYKGTKRGAPPALLRSYDSRKETAAEQKCTIWQAGRGTCAVQLAFKPIQVGQSVFLDEGVGKYNPSPVALDEAVINEWPGREVGVFVSIGTGKRPNGTSNQQQLWWEGFMSGGLSDFAEARRRLISKIEGCEDTHQDMLHGRLADRGVNVENYFRLNVEIGVGEFGMNEWNRLAEISTNTRMYLAQNHVQSMNISAATKLARVWRHTQRWNRSIQQGEFPDPNFPRNSWEYQESNEPEPPSIPGAIELPAADVTDMGQVHFANSNQVHHYSQNHAPQIHEPISPSRPAPTNIPHRDDDKFIVQAPTPTEYVRTSMDQGRPPRRSHDGVKNPTISVTPPPSRDNFAPPPASLQSQRLPLREDSPPPVPPKTPLAGAARLHHPPPTFAAPLVPDMQSSMVRPPAGVVLPYPDTDEPPPIVNKARKPQAGVR